MLFNKLASFEKSSGGRRIFITGHTGFTGSWACLWLASIGAKVFGYALPPDTEPCMYDSMKFGDSITSVLGDIRDYDYLYSTVRKFKPDLVLHLAAQSLVRRSYREPAMTFSVNTQGTANILDIARQVKSIRGVVSVTTDKVYRNYDRHRPYREEDTLGGNDPYSASKSAAELVIRGFSKSFSPEKNNGPYVAIARGGNIIGGGDWSEDRLIPDFVRAITETKEITLRYPKATRPWQHVLALVQGYMMLLAGLDSDQPRKYSRAWNLGPSEKIQYSVRDVLELMSTYWKRPNLNYMDNPAPEASSLALDSSLARNVLGWQPNWDTERVIKETADWYQGYYNDPTDAKKITLRQIKKWRESILK